MARQYRPVKRVWALLLAALATLAVVTHALHDHLMDDEAFEALDEDDKDEMRKREIENCVPHDIRSFVVGSKGVIEWSTRRTYIRKVHRDKKRPAQEDDIDPWQACSDDGAVEVRYRVIGSHAPFLRHPAITHYQRGENVTQHKAWIDLNHSDYEFAVGSTFHGWSSVHRLGENLVLTQRDQINCHPKHVHTAYGKTPGSLTVQWTTMGECIKTPAQYIKLVQGYRVKMAKTTPVTAKAATNLFTDDGSKKIGRFMHVVNLSGLETNAHYTYSVGNDEYSWSIPFTVKTAPSRRQVEHALPLRFLVTGDIGYQNAATLPMMQSEVAEGAVDAIVSMGDYAYDLHLADGRVGDIFMEEIEPIAASVPFMVAPGNHETHNVFSHYTERFRNMPSNTGSVISRHGEAPNNWFYSFNVGLVHFAVISTEIYFKKTLDPTIVERQEEWLRRDLKNANGNHEETPWVIVIGHRPMYCTSDEANCGKKATKLRERLEDLFYEHGVDLYICGHQHNYERAFDIYRSHTWKRTTNMKATTHILTGASGQYKLSIMRKAFEKAEAPWDAFRNSIFGYSRLHVHNATHINWQQVESDPENPAAHGMYGKVADDVWLVQHRHGSFADRFDDDDEEEEMR